MGMRRAAWWFGSAIVLAMAFTPAVARAEVQGIVAPSALDSIAVAYPEGAHGDAVVELELLIAEDGTVARSAVKSGEAPFAEAARAAAENFRFSPAPPPPRDAAAANANASAEVPPDAAKAAVPAPPTAPAAPAEPPEVVVLGEQRTEIGSIHIPKEEARRIPGAFADPFRVVEVLPGVAPVLSGLPYFYVRGAPPGSVGYFIDGVQVPLLFHVGPGPSVIAPALIERVDLYPGSYPARFGRYAGAIFAGETTAPSTRPRGEGQVRIFDASAMVEQPFANGKGNAVIGGRYSYTQAILAAVAPDYKLGYGDYQARLSYAVSPRDQLSFFAFGGFDLLKNQQRGITLFDTAFQRLDLRWDHAFARGRLRLAVTGASDSVFTSPENDGSPSAGSKNESNGVRVRFELEHELGRELRFRAGADFGAQRFDPEHTQVVGIGPTIFPTRTDLAGGGYADLVWRLGRGTEIVPGARVDLLRSRGERHTFFEPRLATRTRLAQGLSYLAGFGLAHQLPASTVLMPGRRPNLLELSNQRSTQANQGLEYALPDGMLGRTTVFYQRVDVDTPGVHGTSYGAEQFLRRDFTHRLGGILSYTLSHADATIVRENVLSSFDRTHVLSLVLGYDLGAGFRLGARGYFASGRAYRVACPTPDCGPGDPTAPRPFTRDLRLPAFFRLDARFEKRWRFNDGVWLTGTLEWFNSLLGREVDNVVYTPNGLRQERQSALTLPSIGIELGY
jgi:hypothetical protein